MNVFEQNTDIKGRKNIYTDKTNIDENNIIDIYSTVYSNPNIYTCMYV